MGTGPVFDGMGLINTIYSYGPEIAISFTSDRDMIPDPANYAAALRESFDELLRAMPKAEVKAKEAAPVKAKPATKAKAVSAKPAAAKPVKKAAGPKAKVPKAKTPAKPKGKAKK